MCGKKYKLILKPEEILQIQCVDYTRFHCPKVKIVASLNGVYLGGQRRSKKIFSYVDKLKKMGMMPGDADLRLHWGHESGPKTLYVELKVGRNKPTPTQLEFQKFCDSIGIPWICCWSLEEYIQALVGHNVPTRKDSWKLI